LYLQGVCIPVQDARMFSGFAEERFIKNNVLGIRMLQNILLMLQPGPGKVSTKKKDQEYNCQPVLQFQRIDVLLISNSNIYTKLNITVAAPSAGSH
jgi:hypothetical protein